MTVRLAVLAMLPACGFASPGHGDGGGDDGSGSDTRVCYGGVFPICFPAATTTHQVFSMLEESIDTGTSTKCDQQNDKRERYCVIAGQSFVISGRFIAHGPKPLVLLSTTTFDLPATGQINVGSDTSAQIIGAGAANGDTCPSVTVATGTSGGHGGSFSGKGGDGSVGTTAPSGSAGVAAAEMTTFPTSLRGGCPGGNAVSGDSSMTSGKGGAGGGAVAIVAMTINLSGTINASGGGGRGGSFNTQGGGGGGGAGGMIVLDGAITRGGTEQLWANGGGGGQGGGVLLGDDGAESAAPNLRGAPGMNVSGGGRGGAGSVGGDRIGLIAGSAPASTAGGGGGGGAGFILAPGITGDVFISPPSQLAP